MISVLIPLLALGLIIKKIDFTCHGIDCVFLPGKEDWNLKEVYENSEKSWKAAFETDKSDIRVEKISHITSEQSDVLTKSRIMQIEGLFENARSPYPGAISDEIECPSEFRPSEFEITSNSNVKITYFKEFLNERMTLGVCDKDDIAHEGYRALFYCKESSTWYQIELIDKSSEKTNEEDVLTFLNGINCQRPSLNMGRLFP